MTEKKENFDKLSSLALNEGMAVFGAADVTSARNGFLIPNGAADSLDYGISIGYRLSKSLLSSITDGPNQLYYFHYQRANILLDQTALKLTAFIQRCGFNALPVPASQVVDWEKQLGSVNHRQIARLAGHGWIGKINLLVNPSFGSSLRFATILTDMPLVTAVPSDEICGECDLCARACPANAITDTEYKLSACSDKLKEFIKTRRIGQMICGVCVNVCPGKGGK